MNKEIPDLCSDKRLCCGCAACFSICPVGAIHMEPDEKGFPYPKIAEDRCVRCYQCLRVCAFKEDKASEAINF
jgi:ferredoxin